MNELLIEGLVLIGSFPVAVAIMRLIFKKSIMYTVSIAMIILLYFISMTQFFSGTKGIITQAWIVPLNFIVGTIIFLFINKLLRKPLEKSISQVKQLSEGNLAINIEETESKNELGILNNSIRQLVKVFNGIVTDISKNAEYLASASQQMSSSSEQLSQGANEQASSIEEVSSTMEEISANIQQNTENSQQTEKVSKEANNGIKVVAERAGKAVEANKDIANKITIINDIAFQTNILALNAAVEAARAGEHGKGFAVVAAEVRKLAERSKVAAEEIVGLAQTSLELAQGAGEVMVQTIPQIDKTSQLIQEITAASMEQNNGASQVNNAIQQLNNVTQQNASASEELASSSEQLAGQAQQLKDLISFFTIENNRTDSSERKFNPSIQSRKNNTRNIGHTSTAPKSKPVGIVKTKTVNPDSEFEKF